MTGKEEKLKSILEENSGRIYRICSAYTPDTDDRDDLYQEIVINIWKNLEGFRGEAAVSTWIYRIAVNTCLLHIRKEKKERERLDSISEELNTAPGKAYADETILKMYEAINRLPAADRLIITMVLEDLSYKEIAEITGMSVSNTGVKISRIKNRLSAMMEEHKNEF
jgi:RNA polymerase sigma-70 factor (ECF subfamily)